MTLIFRFTAPLRKTPSLPDLLEDAGRLLDSSVCLLLEWLRPGRRGASATTKAARGVERPWLRHSWDRQLRWECFSPTTLGRARQRGAAVARLSLGDQLWTQLQAQGYLDFRSAHVPGLTYRLRVGRRVQLLWDTPEAARLIPWPERGYLCIQPVYPLPAIEFLAQLSHYVRDCEAEVIRVAVPQAADGPNRRVF